MIEWLTDTLLATSGLILLVLVLREPVRRRFGPSVAYALWLLPAARLVMPTMTRTVERIVPASTEPSLALAALPVGTAAPAEPGLIEQLGGWPTILIALWLSVAAVMITAGTLTYLRQRRAVLGEGVQLARLGSIRIVRSEAITGPMAFGLLDRVIAIPADFEIRYDERQRRLALDHELAHHASGDLWANLIAFVLLCLQWFNPLAWVAHTAFRFDQEAACDARVLDKVDGPDRAAYGQAIAKAASGRVLLFAGALDRPKTLSRRLNSMLISSNPRRRMAGKVLIAAAAAVALPLTATWATLYVDTIAPVRPLPPTSPIAPVTAVSALAVRPVSALDAAPPVAPLTPLATAGAVTPPASPTPLSPVAPLAPVAPARVAVAASASAHAVATAAVHQPTISFIGNDTVRINGVTKTWRQLTPAERAQIRNETNRAKIQLSRERAGMGRRLEQARREMVKFQNGEFEREMAEARRSVEESLREIEHNKADMRRAGVDVEKIRAQVRASLRDIHRVDVAKIKREAMAGLDPDKMEASLDEAEASLDRVEERLDETDDQ